MCSSDLPRGIGIFDASSRDALLSPLLRMQSRGFQHGIDYLRQDVPPDTSRPGDWLARLEQRGYLSFVLLRDIDARDPVEDITFWMLHRGAAAAALPSRADRNVFMDPATGDITQKRD